MLKAREAEHQRRLEDQAEELRKEAANRREAEEAERRMAFSNHLKSRGSSSCFPKAMPCEKHVAGFFLCFKRENDD